MSRSRMIKPPTVLLSVTEDGGGTQEGLYMLCSGDRLHQIKAIFLYLAKDSSISIAF